MHLSLKMETDLNQPTAVALANPVCMAKQGSRLFVLGEFNLGLFLQLPLVPVSPRHQGFGEDVAAVTAASASLCCLVWGLTQHASWRQDPCQPLGSGRRGLQRESLQRPGRYLSALHSSSRRLLSWSQKVQRYELVKEPGHTLYSQNNEEESKEEI